MQHELHCISTTLDGDAQLGLAAGTDLRLSSFFHRRLLIFPKGNKVECQQMSLYLDFPEAPFTPLHLSPKASFKLTLVNHLDETKSIIKGEGRVPVGAVTGLAFSATCTTNFWRGLPHAWGPSVICDAMLCCQLQCLCLRPAMRFPALNHPWLLVPKESQ